MSQNSISKETNGSLLGEAPMLCFSTSNIDSSTTKQKKVDSLPSAKRKKLNDAGENESMLSDKSIEYDYCESKNIFSTEVSLNSVVRSENDNNDVTVIQHFVPSDLPDISSSPLQSHNTDEYVLFNDVVDCEENVESSVRTLREPSLNERTESILHVTKPDDGRVENTMIVTNKISNEEIIGVNSNITLTAIREEKLKKDPQQKINIRAKMADISDEKIITPACYKSKFTPLKKIIKTSSANISIDALQSSGISATKNQNLLGRTKMITAIIPNTAKVSIGNTTISVPLLKNMALLNNATYLDKTSLSSAAATQTSNALSQGTSQQKFAAALSQLMNKPTNSNIVQATVVQKNLKIGPIDTSKNTNDSKSNIIHTIGFPKLSQLTVLQDVSLPKQIFENESNSPKSSNATISHIDDHEICNEQQLLQQKQELQMDKQRDIIEKEEIFQEQQQKNQSEKMQKESSQQKLYINEKTLIKNKIQQDMKDIEMLTVIKSCTESSTSSTGLGVNNRNSNNNNNSNNNSNNDNINNSKNDNNSSNNSSNKNNINSGNNKRENENIENIIKSNDNDEISNKNKVVECKNEDVNDNLSRNNSDACSSSNKVINIEKSDIGKENKVQQIGDDENVKVNKSENISNIAAFNIGVDSDRNNDSNSSNKSMNAPNNVNLNKSKNNGNDNGNENKNDNNNSNIKGKSKSPTVSQLSPLSKPNELTTNMANVAEQLRTIMSNINSPSLMSSSISQHLPKLLKKTNSDESLDNLQSKITEEPKIMYNCNNTIMQIKKKVEESQIHSNSEHEQSMVMPSIIDTNEIVTDNDKNRLNEIFLKYTNTSSASTSVTLSLSSAPIVSEKTVSTIDKNKHINNLILSESHNLTEFQTEKSITQTITARPQTTIESELQSKRTKSNEEEIDRNLLSQFTNKKRFIEISSDKSSISSDSKLAYTTSNSVIKPCGTNAIVNFSNSGKINKIESSQNVLLKQLLQNSTTNSSSNKNTSSQINMPVQRKIQNLRAPSLGVVSSLEAQLARPVIPPVVAESQPLLSKTLTDAKDTTTNNKKENSSISSSNSSFIREHKTSSYVSRETSFISNPQSSVTKIDQNEQPLQNQQHHLHQLQQQQKLQQLVQQHQQQLQLQQQMQHFQQVQQSQNQQIQKSQQTVQKHYQQPQSQQIQFLLQQQNSSDDNANKLNITSSLGGNKSVREDFNKIPNTASTEITTHVKSEYSSITKDNSNLFPNNASAGLVTDKNIKMNAQEVNQNNLNKEIINDRTGDVKTKLTIDPNIAGGSDIRKITTKRKRDFQKNKKQQLSSKEIPLSAPKKRGKKADKVDQDYDDFIDNLMVQIRQLPPLQVLEPLLNRNFNICNIYGSSQITPRSSNLQEKINIFNCKDIKDFYNMEPFGPENPFENDDDAESSIQNGFYDQEFPTNSTYPYIVKTSNALESTLLNRDLGTPSSVISCSSGAESDDESKKMNLIKIEPDQHVNQPELRQQFYLDGKVSPLVDIISPISRKRKYETKIFKDINNEYNSYETSDKDKTKFSRRHSNKQPNLTVTLTLTPNIAENIFDILKELSHILRVPSPDVLKLIDSKEDLSFHVQKSTSTSTSTSIPTTVAAAASTTLMFDNNNKHNLTIKNMMNSLQHSLQPLPKESIDIQAILNSNSKFCRHCDVLIVNAKLRFKNPLQSPQQDNIEITMDGEEKSVPSFNKSGDLYFCSKNCYNQYQWRSRITNFNSCNKSFHNRSINNINNHNNSNNNSNNTNNNSNKYNNSKNHNHNLHPNQMHNHNESSDNDNHNNDIKTDNLNNENDNEDDDNNDNVNNDNDDDNDDDNNNDNDNDNSNNNSSNSNSNNNSNNSNNNSNSNSYCNRNNDNSSSSSHNRSNKIGNNKSNNNTFNNNHKRVDRNNVNNNKNNENSDNENDNYNNNENNDDGENENNYDNDSNSDNDNDDSYNDNDNNNNYNEFKFDNGNSSSEELSTDLTTSFLTGILDSNNINKTHNLASSPNQQEQQQQQKQQQQQHQSQAQEQKNFHSNEENLKIKRFNKEMGLKPPIKFKRKSEKEIVEMLFRMSITVTPQTGTDDTRQCIFCSQIGDGVPDGPSRLLNFDVDKWVHLNCALWSDGVYETVNGGLMNFETAIQASLNQCCVICHRTGATVKCFKTRCCNIYHLSCALKDQCVFYKNKTVFCSIHASKNEKDNELNTLNAQRRIYIERDENRQVASIMHQSEICNLLRVGNLILLNVGQLLPNQLTNFHNENYIYPVGYKIIRFYWSMTKSNKRCRFVCSIADVDNEPEFRVIVQESNEPDLEFKGATPKLAWLPILNKMADLRRKTKLVNVFPKYLTGEDLFGLTEPAITRILESLPGVDTLTDYRFKYGRNPLLELPLAINPSGAARTEQKQKLSFHWKRSHTQRTSSTTNQRCPSFIPPISVAGEVACPYSKQFVHSKSSQYKKMKQEWRNNVYLARSKIQGLGLYAARELEKHTMVIEYIGEIIRTELSELREKQYEARNRGIYMFRLDEDRVVDATLSGGLARYINHSCNPNCVTEIVEVDRELRIIIFARRRIDRGEELSYDYKFDLEDDANKISCMCGAPNCRKWMN